MEGLEGAGPRRFLAPIGPDLLHRLLWEEHEARRRAEAASRAKDEFLAGVSHELRSPLTAILGWVQVARARRADQTMTDRALDTIERSARTMAELVTELLEISRIVTGQVQLAIEPVELVPLVVAVLEACSVAAEAKGVRVTMGRAPASCRVAGDARRLQQVVGNLLSNAIKFTPAGGRVEVRVEASGGTECAVVVADTGRGIQPEFLPYVFERFRQSDEIRREFPSGLGLGLAIVRQLVELHGGTATAESEGPGRGATFRVSLPFLADAGSGPPSHRGTPNEWPLEATALAGLRVLVVEDEPDSREFVRLSIESAGARVAAAASAAEAMRPARLVSARRTAL